MALDIAYLVMDPVEKITFWRGSWSSDKQLKQANSRPRERTNGASQHAREREEKGGQYD
jgi:hypothetical protein